MGFELGPRRGIYVDIEKDMDARSSPLSQQELEQFERLDLFYRSLCTLLFNYVPTSGHPGGSISAGRILAGLLFDAMDYDVSRPDREDADIISFGGGHKVLGLYTMWALRNEAIRIGAPRLMAQDVRHQMRMEDLLGFRRNPVTKTPLFLEFHSKPLDGHPTPATPFVRLSTGASGVGIASSIGLAFGARDYYGKEAPRVHLLDGEGGMTPGRVSEALAGAGTASLDNAILHVDWNQASIDSNHVCREDGTPGDYVQWTPMELCYFHDWNVVYVPDGMDFRQIIAGQRKAVSIDNGQPTAVVYRTVKGWQYGIEGKAAHGAGHKLCSEGFYEALAPLSEITEVTLPQCEAGEIRCAGEGGAEVMEGCLWEALTIVRGLVEGHKDLVDFLVQRLTTALDRLDRRSRKPRAGAPRLEVMYERAKGNTPQELLLSPGTVTTLRVELGRVLGHYNTASGGAVFSASADLLGSTSVIKIAEGFPEGYFNASSNPEARLLSIGGICEDAISGVLSGIATFGRHTGVASSYGAFIAPLGHIAARLHAIGNQARREISPETPYRPMILVCAHAGLETGEDGPTHADPQALQLLQENFPKGVAITLTPWAPQEIWYLMAAALNRRPALIFPFVTRPNVKVLDLKGLGLPDPKLAGKGLYLLRAANGQGDGTVVLQGSAVTYGFIEAAMPLLEKDGIDLNVYSVASAELFDSLSPEEQESIYPEKRSLEAIGITGFTLPTMYRWIRSEEGRRATIHPFQKGHYLGSGQAEMVLAEAGLDGESQYRSIKQYLEKRRKH